MWYSFRRVKENELKKKEAKEKGQVKIDCKRKVIDIIICSWKSNNLMLNWQ